FFVLFSKSQSAGRGRMGKSFISKKGGLYFSIILRPENLIKNSIFITPAAAVAAAKAIEKISGKEAKIKWVNDIFIADKKVCGILCESRLDLENSAAEYVILGVGINVFRPKGGYEKEIENIADALFSSDENGQAYLLLAAEFLNNFKEYYEKIEKKQYMKEYIDRSYLKNKEISFFKDSKFHSARVVDTDMDGNLIIEENGERKRLYSGEVSVKI
ncbi:MAG: biotin--[acetyl-CoA-carboxylase] ligase, partial [Clostridia bacterium]|nr:biotin--[acetyl-CoA-carboxylase] ligase [Clostridia bacterium]